MKSILNGLERFPSLHTREDDLPILDDAALAELLEQERPEFSLNIAVNGSTALFPRRFVFFDISHSPPSLQCPIRLNASPSSCCTHNGHLLPSSKRLRAVRCARRLKNKDTIPVNPSFLSFSYRPITSYLVLSNSLSLFLSFEDLSAKMSHVEDGDTTDSMDEDDIPLLDDAALAELLEQERPDFSLDIAANGSSALYPSSFRLLRHYNVELPTLVSHQARPIKL
ncbi:MAG: hypothetical protein TREMPRED_002615 [Tremellales sp. Tagirdzhanova-0007]|nr:MAG: hypothetical protein TREMPRED_002615 [Tremellales sp. Tagirdzhanova-0007]